MRNNLDFRVLLFLLIFSCKNNNQDEINIYRELGEINEARIEARKLFIPLDLVEIINFNSWKWSDIKEGYLYCLAHPSIEVGAAKETIEKLCLCEMNQRVKRYKFSKGKLMGATLNELTKITLECIETSGLRNEMIEDVGLEPNTNTVDMNISFESISHLYGKNNWTTDILQSMYATSISNESLRKEFAKIGLNSSSYDKYSLCLIESIVNNLTPTLMLANPVKFSELSNDLAKICVSNLKKNEQLSI
ncbi:MAG: hypothetical protein KDC49_05600 [Saprospiraceae bacterium]|nr:hypothetical protein [Saprospiraceae bacterium]